MRSTTVFSFLAASLALLTQSPAAYAAPVPYEVDPAGVKRRCYMGSCKFAEPSPETDTVSTPASATNLLVKMLIETLENYQNITLTSSGTPSVNLATPVEPETVSPDDSLADPVVDPTVDTL